MSHLLAAFAGALIGLMASRISVAEPMWFLLIIPTGFAIAAAVACHVYETETLAKAYKRN